MKILMLTPYLPYPPSSGGQVRSYNLIKNLALKHKITLFSLIKNDEERKHINQLQRYCQKVRVFRRPFRPWTVKNILKTGLGLYPFLVIRNFSEEEKEAVKNELKEDHFDLIHAENFYVMPHIPKTSIPILLTEQTVFYRVYQHFVDSLPWYLFWLKPIFKIDVLKLKHWETFYWKTADFLAVVSEEDRALIRGLTGRRKVHLVPNGVDYQYFSQRPYQRNNYPTILFGAADFHWMQNKEGAEILIREIWPKIKKEVKNAKLWIVGKIAPRVLSAYSDREDIIIQEVADAREAYQKAWILVAPMRSGGGSRTKLFEAMASGLPILTTPEGIEGITIRHESEVIVEDKLNRLAEKAVELILDRKKAQKIVSAAKKLVKERYDWNRSAAILDRLYEEVGRGKS